MMKPTHFWRKFGSFHLVEQPQAGGQKYCTTGMASDFEAMSESPETSKSNHQDKQI